MFRFSSTTFGEADLLFVEYLPEDGRRKPKHAGLLHVYIVLYPIIGHLLKYRFTVKYLHISELSYVVGYDRDL